MNARTTGALLLASCLLGCATPKVKDGADARSIARSIAGDEPINPTCPRSGKPVAADSLTVYRGYVVGFCNTHCRDDFAANVAERPKDREAFDRWIAGAEGTR